MTGWVRPAALAGLVAMVLLAPGTVAHAAPADDVVVSADGTTWSDALPSPLFDPGFRWVPGDVRTAAFWVGNRADDAGDLAIVARTGAGSDGSVADHVTLEARRASGSWVVLRADGRSRSLPGTALAAGAEERVLVRAGFSPGAGNPTQRRRLLLDFEVVLSRTPGVAGPDDGPGALPAAGGPGGAVLALGLVLVAGGSLVVGAVPYLSPGRKDDDEQTTR